jgi:2-keto-4-pentenoate hydratase/2-oxohepta-3-ene-1,7-dioic acid hydratase in catechol pathway
VKVARVRTAEGAVRAATIDGERIALAPPGIEAIDLLLDPGEIDATVVAGRWRGLSEVELLAPVPNPPKFIGIAFNTETHRAEPPRGEPNEMMKRALNVREHVALAHPDRRYPTFFNKQSTAVTGPYDPIWMPFDSSWLDYEGELLIVIGSTTRRVDPAAAARAIAGYAVCNDVSVRDWQLDTPTI